MDNRSAEHRNSEGAAEFEALYDATLAEISNGTEALEQIYAWAAVRNRPSNSVPLPY